MEPSKFKQNDIIERYLLNQLDEDEQTAFEEYYLENPECLEELENAERFLRGMRQQDVSVFKNTTSEVPFFQQLLNTIFGPSPARLAFLAAAFVVALPMSYQLGRQAVPVHTTKDQMIKPVIVDLGGGLRSVDPSTNTEISTATTSNIFVFRIFVPIEPTEGQTFSFSLYNKDKELIWQSDSLMAEPSRDYISLGFESNFLKPNQYYYELKTLSEKNTALEKILDGTLHIK